MYDYCKIKSTVTNYKNYRSAKIQWAFYGGPVIGESAVKHLNEVGPKVSHIYEVFNEGPWRVSSLEIRISWPYEVANDKAHGKWLLYLEELPTVQGEILYFLLHKIKLVSCLFISKIVIIKWHSLYFQP